MSLRETLAIAKIPNKDVWAVGCGGQDSGPGAGHEEVNSIWPQPRFHRYPGPVRRRRLSPLPAYRASGSFRHEEPQQLCRPPGHVPQDRVQVHPQAPGESCATEQNHEVLSFDFSCPCRTL